MTDDARTVVKAILTRIKDAVARRERLVRFDFMGPQYVVSRAIHQILTDKGYVSYILLGGREDLTDRLYIDLTRKRLPRVVPPPLPPPDTDQMP